MATATLQVRGSRVAPRYIGPDSAGITLTPRQFDEAEFLEGWRYELIHGVLVVSPTPLEKERDPNEELGYLLRDYQRNDPQGQCIDKTLFEPTVRVGRKRRRADRVIWIGLGRVPTERDIPCVIAEFVSTGKRDWLRDYVEKRDEYMAIGVLEYWIFDRFRRTLTVFTDRENALGSKRSAKTRPIRHRCYLALDFL
jgi:Uma2 family endonuclease